MSFRKISEVPVQGLRGGIFDNATQNDVGSLNLNVVWDDEDEVYYGFFKGGGDFGAQDDDAVMRIVWDPEDFIGKRKNDVLRTADLSTNPVQSDGLRYIFHWTKGTGNVTGWGTAPLDADLDPGDGSVAIWDDNGTQTYVYMQMARNHPTSGNTWIIMHSTDKGLNWTYMGEATSPGGGAYTNQPGGQFVWSNKIYVLTSSGNAGEKLLRSSSDGGLNWTNHGVALPAGEEFFADETGKIIGRGFVVPASTASGGSRVFAIMPASPDQSDAPVSQVCFYCDVDDLEDGEPWTRTPYPISGTDPTAQGEWQYGVMNINGTYYAAFNQWSHIGYEEVHTEDMIRLQDQQYYAPDGAIAATFAQKHVYVKRMTWPGFWNYPDYDPFDTLGPWYFFRDGLFLARSLKANEPIRLIPEPDETCLWVTSREVGHLTLSNIRAPLDADNGSGLLGSPGVQRILGANNRWGVAEYTDDIWRMNRMPQTALPQRAPTQSFNDALWSDRNRHWIPLFLGDEDDPAPKKVVLQNRRTRWIIRRNGTLGPDRGDDRDAFRMLASV